MSDPLTGVGNRRLGEALMVGWLEQHRESTGCSASCSSTLTASRA